MNLFMKKTEKKPPKEMEIALRRLKEWKDADA
jgi:phage-related protein